MDMRRYHIGLTKPTPSNGYNYLSPKTLVVEACKCIDNLSCEIYEYFGERQITKKELRAKRAEILADAQKYSWAPEGGFKYVVIV